MAAFCRKPLRSVTGRQFAEKLAPLDRKHAGVVSTSGGGAPSWSLPPAWEGQTTGSSEGSVAKADDKPVWKLEQIWPPDPKQPANYRPMIWTGTDRNVQEGGFGGQPGARLEGRTLTLATRAPHGNPPQWRVAALTFVAPQSGTYVLSGTAECRIWDGKNKTALRLFHKQARAATEVGHVVIPHGGKTPLDSLRITLAAGEEFALVPQIGGAWSGGDCKLRDLCVTLGASAGAASTSRVVFRLPDAWEGEERQYRRQPRPGGWPTDLAH